MPLSPALKKVHRRLAPACKNTPGHYLRMPNKIHMRAQKYSTTLRQIRHRRCPKRIFSFSFRTQEGRLLNPMPAPKVPAEISPTVFWNLKTVSEADGKKSSATCACHRRRLRHVCLGYLRLFSPVYRSFTKCFAFGFFFFFSLFSYLVYFALNSAFLSFLRLKHFFCSF